MNTAITRRNATFPGLLGRSVFDDIFDSFFTDVPTYVQKSTQGYPVADIYSDAEGNTVMEFALAGFTREELTVEVKPEKRTLTWPPPPIQVKIMDGVSLDAASIKRMSIMMTTWILRAQWLLSRTDFSRL